MRAEPGLNLRSPLLAAWVIPILRAWAYGQSSRTLYPSSRNEGIWKCAWNSAFIQESITYTRISLLNCVSTRLAIQRTEFLARIPFESFSGALLGARTIARNFVNNIVDNPLRLGFGSWK